MPLIGLGAGTALGIGKHFLIDKPAADRKRKVAAEQTRWSPWTGMGLGDPGEEPNIMGSALGYGSMGAGMGQSITNAKTYNDALQSMAAQPTKVDGITQMGQFSDPNKNYFGSGMAALPMSTEMYPEKPSVYQYKGAPWSPSYR